MPSFHDDISPRDLSEAPRLERESQSRGLLIGIAVGALLFVGLLILGSQPDLSPEEIVSMEGYGGEQPTRHIFNLESFEESDVVGNVSDAADSNGVESTQKASMPGPGEKGNDPIEGQANTARVVAPTAPKTPIRESSQRSVAVETNETQRSQIVKPKLETRAPQPDTTEPVRSVVNEIATTETIEPAVVQSTEQEQAQSTVPASTAQTSIFDNVPEQRVVASMATTPRLEEQPDTVVVSTAVVDEFAPMPIGSTRTISSGDSFGSRGVLLPLRSVLNDSTELKDAPDENSETLMLLGQGVVVTALERRGKWILIGTNDASSLTGYVLESGLAKVESQ